MPPARCIGCSVGRNEIESKENYIAGGEEGCYNYEEGTLPGHLLVATLATDTRSSSPLLHTFLLPQLKTKSANRNATERARDAYQLLLMPTDTKRWNLA